MNSEYQAIITFLLAGAALIHLVTKRSGSGKSNMGWIAFFVLGVPIVGMGVASITGSERLVWIFGLLLMLAAPLWFFIAIIAKIVRHLKK